MSDAINPDHYRRLPSEAIEIIESAIDKAPTSQEAYLQGQALKYLLRANHKNGREDIHKAKWYLDRMVASFTVASDLLDHPLWTPEIEPTEQPAIKQSSTTEPPDGWRWLEVGEVIRKGDRYWYENEWHDRHEELINCKYSVCHCQTIRRNRYEVGEKVVYIPDESVWTYMSEINDGPNHPKSAWVKRDGTSLRACANKLAPYIKDAT